MRWPPSAPTAPQGNPRPTDGRGRKKRRKSRERAALEGGFRWNDGGYRSFIWRHVTNPWTVSIASVGYSFIGLLRAGNFKFDYKLPERHSSSLFFAAYPAFPRLSSAFPLNPPRNRASRSFSRDPMKNSRRSIATELLAGQLYLWHSFS